MSRFTGVFDGSDDGMRPDGSVPPPSSAYDPTVDGALVRALEAAAKVGRFDAVAQLAKEIAARRLARKR